MNNVNDELSPCPAGPGYVFPFSNSVDRDQLASREAN